MRYRIHLVIIFFLIKIYIHTFRCKPRWGNCVHEDGATIVHWSVVGDINTVAINEDVLIKMLPKLLNSDEFEVVVKASTEMNECSAGEFIYGGECLSCPLNTYGPSPGASMCEDCPRESVTYNWGSECQEKCHLKEEHDGVFSFKPEVNACAVWKLLDGVYYFCKLGILDGVNEACLEYNDLYELAKDDFITEDVLNEMLSHQVCKTQVSCSKF